MLADLRTRGFNGSAASDALGGAGLAANKNGVCGDILLPAITSGIRFDASAGTARGFETDGFIQIGHVIADVRDAMGSARKTKIRSATRE